MANKAYCLKQAFIITKIVYDPNAHQNIYPNL